jgi:hypothetical protein
MKKWYVLLVVFCIGTANVNAQSFEAQQLLLNVEKLMQFKQILADMKKGYNILFKGYTVIRDISQGNFNLHKTFLDALFEVSPTVRRYKKIAGIVEMQLRLVKQYKAAYKRFVVGGHFTVEELAYLSRVYGRLVDESLKSLDDLAMVITAGRLRMSDGERLSAIDRIYTEMEKRLVFLNTFNGKTSVLAMQRAKESGEVRVLQGLMDNK